MSRKAAWVVAVIVVIIIAGLAYAGLHKSSTSTNTSSGYGSSSTSNNKAKSSTSSTTSTNPAAVVQTKTASNVGSYLADSNGNALYTYGADTTGVSNCTGGCLYNWPIYAPGPTTGLPANVTIITRSDGSKQYAYKGKPLYTFSSDSSGQVTGDGVSNFHVAKP